MKKGSHPTYFHEPQHIKGQTAVCGSRDVVWPPDI